MEKLRGDINLRNVFYEKQTKPKEKGEKTDKEIIDGEFFSY
jgi:hypothetical protein